MESVCNFVRILFWWDFPNNDRINIERQNIETKLAKIINKKTTEDN